jgi:hypothetical protein
MMKNKSLKKLVRVIFTVVLLFTAFFVNAQTGPGGGLEENPDAGVPLDGGVTLLLVMAACYAAFKIWRFRKMSRLSHGSN